MSDFTDYLYVILFIAGLMFLLTAPVATVMYVTNRKQRKIFAETADKYKLKKIFGKKIFGRNFPAVKGYINNRHTYVSARTYGRIYTQTSSLKTYKLPVTEIAVNVEDKDISGFELTVVKKIPKNKDISNSDFFDYFRAENLPEQKKDTIFNDSLKQKLTEAAKKYGKFRFYTEEGYLKTIIFSELKTKKHFEEVTEKIELLHQTAENL